MSLLKSASLSGRREVKQLDGLRVVFSVLSLCQILGKTVF